MLASSRRIVGRGVGAFTGACRLSPPSSLTGLSARALDRSLTIDSSSDSEPIAPENFGKLFQIQRDDEPMALEILNRHPLDVAVSFEEKDHIYKFNEEVVPSSVTQVIGRFFEEFNPRLTAEKMVKGNRWPRPEYTHPSGEPYTIEQILARWDSIGENARNRGTWMHYNIERHLNGLSTTKSNLPELAQYFKFYDKVIASSGMSPYRTEWRVVAPDRGIAGSIDFVGQLPDGSFAIIDWKRAKDLKNSFVGFGGKKASHPISHLYDCDGTKYCLQLNLYRYILQEYYGLTVSKMILASFHEHMESFFAVEVEIWDKDIKAILSH